MSQKLDHERGTFPAPPDLPTVNVVGLREVDFPNRLIGQYIPSQTGVCDKGNPETLMTCISFRTVSG